MIVDAHTHLFGSDVHEAARELIASMDKAGIHKALVFTSPNHDCTNEAVINALAPYRSRLHAIARVCPLEEAGEFPPRSLAHLGRLLAIGAVKGFKFYTGYEHYSPRDAELLLPYLHVLEQQGYPAIFHTGDTLKGVHDARLRYAHPLPIDDLASEFPRLKIVIAHLGNPWMTDAAAVMYKNPNVYADISGWVYGEFDLDDRRILGQKLLEALSYVGSPDKFLFGSDYPVADQKVYVYFVRGLELGEEARRKILGENAMQLFRLGQ